MCAFPYIHSSVDLSDGLIIEGELVNLDAVADQLTHDFNLELVQLALTDGVSFSDHWDDVHLQQDGKNMFMYKILTINIKYTYYYLQTIPADIGQRQCQTPGAGVCIG